MKFGRPSGLVWHLLAVMVLLGFITSFGVGCSSEPVDAPQDVGIDGDVDFDVPPFEANTCGGDGEALEYDGEPASPGESCGECDDGVLVCHGEDALECIGASQKNACGGCGELPAEPDASCGPCDDGVWSCDGENSLVCEEATERNRCGGCEELDQSPGGLCDAGENAGVFRCTHVNTVECIPAGHNACGGDAALETSPTTPCGECNQGVTVCDGTEDVMCHDEEAGQNTCGGCAPLRGVPETSCGFCGGEWYCADDDLSVCDDSSRNPCGGCADLSGELNGAMPGDECGDEGQVWACRSFDEVICPDEATNACGGGEELDALPGEVCGECGDGLTICTAPDSVICHGATESNACGGCGLLPGEEGDECGSGATWECSDDGSMRCQLDEDRQLNACGGTESLDGVLGQPCGPCDLDVLVCDGENALVCSGDTACPDLVGDEVTVSDVEKDSASFEAELISLPAAAVTEHGFCWSDEQDPAGDDDHCESLGEATEVGTFSMDVEELVPGIEYHVVAFVTVAEQTTTTEEISYWTKTEAPQVTATTDLHDQVALSWESVEGADHYLVLRDGTEIGEVDAGDTSFSDMGADEAPAPDAPQITSASDDLTEGVEVVWDEPSVQPGTLHEYDVIAINADELESGSGQAGGQRAAYEIDEYEICIGADCGDDDWTELESPQGTTADLIYLDTTAPLAAIEGGSATASEGEFEDFVRLAATGWQIEEADERAYQVRAISEAGAGEASNAESGRRATEELQYEWFASALDASGNFTSIYGPASNANSYDDADAPEDGSDRHYYVRLSANGAASLEFPGTDNPLVGFVMSQAAVITLSAENVGTNSATLRGRLNYLGNPPAVEVGLCWNRFQPAEDGNCVAVEPMVGEGEEFETSSQTLGSGRTYYLRAYLEDEDGHRVYGDHRSFTTRPGTPSGVEITNTPDHVEISWDSVRGATSYRIIRDGSVIGTTSSTSYEDDSLDAGSLEADGEIEVGAAEVRWQVDLKSDEATTEGGDTAEYQVQAVNSTGAGGISSSVSGQPILENLQYIWQFYDADTGDEDCTEGEFEDVQDVDCSDAEGRNCIDQNGMEDGDTRCYRMKVSADGEDDVLSDRKSYTYESVCDPDASPFGDGKGTSQTPHLLCTAEHLNAVGDSDSSDACQNDDCLDDHFRMVADINMEDLPDGVEFNIIGDNDNPFEGTFDGGGHVIKNLKVHQSGDNYVALIGDFVGGNDGEIKNVGLEDVDIEGERYVGGLVGKVSSGTITNSYAKGSVVGTSLDIGGLVGRNLADINKSYATGSVDGDLRVGGLVGYNLGDISKSYATSSIDGSFEVGGLVGQNEGEISESYATGSVDGDRNSGGLVGYNREAEISKSYATGSVVGSDREVGGLVGQNQGDISESYATGSVDGDFNIGGGLVGYNLGDISKSYATGSVDGDFNIGGLVGYNAGAISKTYATGSVFGGSESGGLVGTNWGEISKSYATGSVDGSFDVGGLVGTNYADISKSYWDKETSGHEGDNDGVGDGSHDGVTGRDTDDFSEEGTFIGWNFDETWTIAAAPDGYPRPIFQWEIVDE